MLKCLLLNDNAKVQFICDIKKLGSRKLNFAFYCVFICVIEKKAVLLRRHSVRKARCVSSEPPKPRWGGD